MPRRSHEKLSRRERQIMDVVYARGKASATEVLADLPDPPSRASVRTILRILEEKGHLRHAKRGREFVFEPLEPRKRAGQAAMLRVIRTFFDGSLEKAVGAHLADARSGLSEEELDQVADLIRRARRRKGD